jgi:hypothetical protein
VQEASADIERRWARVVGSGELQALTATLQELDALGCAPIDR